MKRGLKGGSLGDVTQKTLSMLAAMACSALPFSLYRPKVFLLSANRETMPFSALGWNDIHDITDSQAVVAARKGFDPLALYLAETEHSVVAEDSG